LAFKIKLPKIRVKWDPAKDVRNLGKNIGREWKNAGRGEIGKWASGVGQSAYNLALSAPRAVVTGQYSKEFQRAGGSYLNLATGGTASYVGQSSSLQKTLRSDPIFGENIGGFTSAVNTSSRDGRVSNSDRNLILQGAVKSAAVVGAVYGGSALYSAYGTGGSTTAATSVEGLGVLNAPAYGAFGTQATLSSSAALTSTVSAGGGWGLWEGTKSLFQTLGITSLASNLIGQRAQQLLQGDPGGGPGGGDPGFIPAPFFGGYGDGGAGASAPEVSEFSISGRTQMFILAGLGILIIAKVVRE